MLGKNLPTILPTKQTKIINIGVASKNPKAKTPDFFKSIFRLLISREKIPVINKIVIGFAIVNPNSHKNKSRPWNEGESTTCPAVINKTPNVIRTVPTTTSKIL